MNKKGMYLATLSILVVFMMIMGYKILSQKQEIKINAGNIGKSSISILNGNIDGEKLKFYIEKSIEVSKNLALEKTKLNGGVYDKTNCQINGEYVVLTENCDYSNPENSFYNYFKDNFTSILKKYNEEYSSSDFKVEVLNGVLGVEGSKQIPLNVKIIKSSKKTEISEESKYDETLNHDDILEYIKEYSELNNVPEDLVKAVIMKESSGNVNARNDNINKETGEVDSTDYGLMQVNNKAHPEWFNGNKGCLANENVKCNINAGTEILREGYDNFKDGKTYGCTGKTYANWEAALRAYNGWGCINLDYVESVLSILGGELPLYVESGEITQEKFGFITVNIDYEENVNYNFDNIGNVILKGRTIKNCVDNKGEVNVCASKESGEGYNFNAKIENEVLKFDVEEFETDDVIKFGLNI